MLLWYPGSIFVGFSCRLTRPFPPSKDQLSDWLQKRDSHPIVELSYLEVGLGSQSIHMQFGDGGAAYTLLVRDSLRCKRFFGLLTGKLRPAWNTQSISFFLEENPNVGSVCNSGILLAGIRIACSPHKPYICYDRQISAPSPEGKPRRTSGELWKMNPTITSAGEKNVLAQVEKFFRSCT